MMSAPPCSQTTTGRTVVSLTRGRSAWMGSLARVLYVQVFFVKVVGSSALAWRGRARVRARASRDALADPVAVMEEPPWLRYSDVVHEDQRPRRGSVPATRILSSPDD